jgi:acetyl esterase/lipase
VSTSLSGRLAGLPRPLWVLLLILPLIAGTAFAPRPVALAGPRTVTYCSGQAMDIYEPAGLRVPAPVVLHIHGGSLRGGHRSSDDFFSEPPVVPWLVAHGFVVASIDYRLLPRNPWPDQIVDAGCAVRYLRAHAARLDIDPDRVGAIGTSAGGFLASFLGTASGVPHPFFDRGAYAGRSSAVDAVVDLYGHVDPGQPHGYLGHHVSTRTRDQSIPASHITPQDPPFLIIQGMVDRRVPARDSRRLYEQLCAQGVPATLVMVHNGPHGLEQADERPDREVLAVRIEDFLERQLVYAGTRTA